MEYTYMNGWKTPHKIKNGHRRFFQ